MPLTLRTVQGIDLIDRGAWNALAKENAFPFLEWEWLAALEKSESICPATGWYPLHFTLWDGDELVGAAPFYLKTHSFGEFVFDFFWAEAAQTLKRPYYPKLVGVVPATPAVGYRFLHRKGEDPAAIRKTFLDAAEALCRKNDIAGMHILFPDPAWAEGLAESGFVAWQHHHYEWGNRGFSEFQDYLNAFTKNQRKNIRKERSRPGEQGVTLRLVPGKDADAGHFKRMFDLYTVTNDKFAPYDARYVNEKFFTLLEETFRDKLLFVEASRNEDVLAQALLVANKQGLWGRYWGSYEEIRDLHFEACYYGPIEHAIRSRIPLFDPGAGSPHKIRRGFLAKPDFSYHRLFDPALDSLFRTNIDMVNRYEEETIEELNAESPLKRSGSSSAAKGSPL